MEFYGLLGEKLGHSLSPQINKIILERNVIITIISKWLL